jgi:hypothetical protein
MTMTKKDFIALADEIRDHNRTAEQFPHTYVPFTAVQLNTLAAFCAKQNSNFKRDRWLSYIAGECGKNGGAVKGGR